MKPFDLERALAGDPVVTRNGQKITRVAYLRKPVVAHIDGYVHASAYTQKGEYLGDHEEHPLDLFMGE